MAETIKRSLLAAIFVLNSAVIPMALAQSAQSNSQTDDLTVAVQLNKEVVTLFNRGDYKEALPLARRVVEITEKKSSTTGQDLRSAWRNLAEIYVALRRYNDAKPVFQQLINSYEESAPNDPALVDVLQRMAMVQFARGNDKQSEQAYQRSVEVAEKQAGPDSLPVAKALTFLGEAYQQNGDYQRAETVLARALSIRESAEPTRPLGTVSPDLGGSIARYGCILRKLKRQEEADRLFTRFFGVVPEGAERVVLTAPVSGGVLNGRAISLPRPSYPIEARNVHAQGTVTVHVIIDETGKVVFACAISGPPTLHKTSERSAYGALFTPTIFSGKPVKVVGVITYNFITR